MAGSERTERAAAAPRAKPCPVCKRPSAADHRPFCSARCKDVDLHRWLTGAYAIPGKDADNEDDGEA